MDVVEYFPVPASLAHLKLRSVLERHGSSMDHVIKCTAMLADMHEWAPMNRIYVEYFPTNLPARSAFGTSGLALGGRVELECVALIGQGLRHDSRRE